MVTVNVQQAFKMLATATVSVSREAAGTYDAHGRWVAGTASVSSIVASVQPLTPKEKQELPENRRFTESIKLYTESELRPGSVSAKTQPDVLTWDSRSWEVLSVERFPSSPVYYKVIATLKGQG